MLLFAIVTCFVIVAIIAATIKKRQIVEVASVTASTFALGAASLISYKVGTVGEYDVAGILAVDSLAALVILIVAVVGFFATMYAVPYFRKESAKKIIGPWRVRQYYALTNLFLAAIFLSATANNPVVAWIFLEVTTLSTAFLISYYNRRSTIEAAWKYLIINAVGLLLAFLGTILYFTVGGSENATTWQELVVSGASLDPAIAKIAFAFVIVGYGVKIGFAPMHTWKPDAYGKSPAPLGALFSGALLPVAFAMVLRFKLITDTAIGSTFSDSLFIIFGMMSMLVAAFCILTSHNYKRVLAYSSIEHAGIMALGFGFGGLGALGAVMHMVYHSLIKPSLFFTTGNVLIKYNSARIARVSGAMAIIPITSILLFIGLFAVTGFPPFGMFLTEMSIITAGLQTWPVVAVVALMAIALVFVGFFRRINAMVMTPKPIDRSIKPGESNLWLIVPPLALLVIALVTSFYMPHFLQVIVNEVASRY